eukprot:1858674-Alexandrium_andersonii.AAC.1
MSLSVSICFVHVVRAPRQQAQRLSKSLEEKVLEASRAQEAIAFHGPKRQKRGDRVHKFHRVSVRGGYALAVKRNLGHAATQTLIDTLTAPLSRQSLNRWESLLSASVIIQSRDWYAQHYEFLRHVQTQLATCHPSFTGFSFEIHFTRADATNSST